jgi:membrane-associated phospholipid phosphatase
LSGSLIGAEHTRCLRPTIYPFADALDVAAASDERRCLSAARLSGVATVLLVAVYVLAVSSGAVRELERSVLEESPYSLHDLLVGLVIVIVNPVTVTLAGLLAMRHAFRADGLRAAAGIAIVILGTILSAQGLKAGLGALDPFGSEARRALGRAFFPSGHAAAAMTVALIAVRTASAQQRRTVALVAAAAVGGYGTLLFTSDNHHPLDVIGGVLLSVAWSVALVALWPVRDRRDAAPARSLRSTLASAGLARAAVALAAAVVVGAIALQLADLRPWRPLMLLSALVITLTTFALLLAFERTLVHPTPGLPR